MWASLPDGEDWLLRPVVRQMCQYESLLNGAIGLEDIALMNDALDVLEENREIARKMQQ